MSSSEVDLKIAVDEAMAPAAGRHEAEQLRVANDATLAKIQAMGYSVSPQDIANLHVAVLLDTLLGDMDDPRRQAYEIVVHTRMAELLAEVSSQVARRKLVEGIQGVDPSKLPKRPGR